MKLISSLIGLTGVLADSVLFLHDGSNMEASHSIFLNQLKSKNFDITIKPADDPQISLMEYGVLKYDHLVLFAPNADEFGGDISPLKIANFVDNGGNVLIGLDSRVTDTVRATASEFGVETDTEEYSVIDHFNYDDQLDEGEHTILSYKVNQFYSDARPFLPLNKRDSKTNSDSILFEGIGMELNKNNNLVAPILSASQTAYSGIPNSIVNSMPFVLGKDMALISALEAKNNARVLISGSLKFFSDEFASRNQEYALQLALWAFQRAGVLKLENTRHFITETQETLETYTILDDVTYSTDIYEKDEITGNWVPTQNTDIQVEFTRMDPFVRRFLKKSGAGASQIMQFILPDTYGVFKFIIDYKRVGWTYLQQEVTVPVRPLQHTQYERFIVAAYPYYAGAGSMLVGLFLFSFVFLYHK